MMEACGKILPFFVWGGLGRSNMVNLRSPCLGSTGASERWFPPGRKINPSRAPKRLEVGKKMKRT